jgi:HSP20 family protein
MLPVRIFNRPTDGWGPGPLSTWSRWPLEFEDLFGRALSWTGHSGFRVNVRREGEDLVIEAELPGLSRDDVEITVENQILTIAGEYKEVKEEEKTEYEIRERRYGRISRSFNLPDTADGEHVTAELKDGVLTLRVPTREEAKPRRIEVHPG